MSEGRDIYHEPKQKVLLRTADVYQTEVDDEVAGYSDKLLAIVADYHNGGRPEGMNAQAMVGKSKRGEVAFRLFGRINPRDARHRGRRLQDARMPGDDGVRERHLLDDRGAHFRRGAGAHH